MMLTEHCTFHRKTYDGTHMCSSCDDDAFVCRWVNAPPCDSCGRETFNVGMGTALPSEIKFGANRVEIYR
jgi:Zn finger protein HypA/HybF involved in hydrogenase expression